MQDVSGYFESEFWDYLVLQVSHTEPTVRHALLALSSIYESSEANELAQEASAGPVNTFALQQYTKAVRLLGIDLSTRRSPHLVLMSCLIFIWFEFLQDNLDTALNHLKSGLQILQDLRQSSDPQNIDGSLVRLYARLHIQATTHGSPTSDYNSNPPNKDLKCSSLMPSTFSNIFEARKYLDDEHDSIFQFHRRTQNPDYVTSTMQNHPYPDPLSLEAIRQYHLHSLQQ